MACNEDTCLNCFGLFKHITSLEVDIFMCYGKGSYVIVAFRLMCTVSAFFSVKCASENYLILKGVINKSQW